MNRGNEALARASQPGRLELAKAGDREALKALVEASYEPVRRMLFRFVGPGADLEDLTQMVLMRMLRGLPSYRGESAYSTWLGGICVHISRDYFRRRKVRTVVTSDDALDEHPSPAQSVDLALADQQRLADAHRALERLSPNHRTVFVLRVVLGHSVDEIATMMNAARSTTRLRLYYARRAFVRAMAELGVEVITEDESP